jgi:small acid-soluble spore protein I
MDVNLKSQTLQKLKGFTEQDIKYMIMDAMHHNDKSTLENLGILFEIIWQDSNPFERKQMIKYIKRNI